MSLINFFASAGRAFAEWRRRQRAYQDLMALDDHCLADLGITRAEINAYLARGRGDRTEGAGSPAASPTLLFGRRRAA